MRLNGSDVTTTLIPKILRQQSQLEDDAPKSAFERDVRGHSSKWRTTTALMECRRLRFIPRRRTLFYFQHLPQRHPSEFFFPGQLKNANYAFDNYVDTTEHFSMLPRKNKQQIMMMKPI